MNAAGYVRSNIVDVRTAIQSFLIVHPPELGDPRVTFIEPGYRALVAELVRPLNGDDSAPVHALRGWLGNTSLDEVVDRSRAILEEPTADDAGEYTGGPKGPDVWRAPVGAAIAAQVALALGASFARIVPRLIARTAQLRRETGRADARLTSGTRLVASSPIDVDVARAMVDAATVIVAAGVSEVAKTATRAITEIEWQGLRGGPWNAVRVLPAEATPEDVAAALLGGSAQAFRVHRIGALFLIPEDAAITHREALAGKLALHGTQSAEAKVAFGAHVGTDIDAEAARGMATTVARSADPAAMLGQWNAIQEQLASIDQLVAPFGFGAQLAATMVVHAQRKSDLATLQGPAAVVRAAGFEQQHLLLARITPRESGRWSASSRARTARPATPTSRCTHCSVSSSTPQACRICPRPAPLSACSDQRSSSRSLFDSLAAELRQARHSDRARDVGGRRASRRPTCACSERTWASRADRSCGRAHASSSSTSRTAVISILGARSASPDHRATNRRAARRADRRDGELDELEDSSGWVLFSEAVTAPVPTTPAQLVAAEHNHIGRLEDKRRAAAEAQR